MSFGCFRERKTFVNSWQDCPSGKPSLISLRNTLPSCHKPIEEFLLGVKAKKYVQDMLLQEKALTGGYIFPAFYLHLQDQLETVHVEVLASTDFT